MGREPWIFYIPIDIFKWMSLFATKTVSAYGSSPPKSHEKGYLNF